MLQLAVHLDPQRLEDARGGVFAGVAEKPLGDALRNGGGQVPGGADRLRLPDPHDAAGDCAAEMLFSEFGENAFEVVFVEMFQQLPRRLALRRVEAKIERSARVEAEPAAGVRKLVGRQTQVEQHAIDGQNVEGVKNVGKTGVTGLDEMDVVPPHLPRREPQHHRIAVESDEGSGGTDTGEDVLAVAAATDGAVHHHVPRLQIKPGEHFAQKHRLMTGNGRTCRVRRRLRHETPGELPPGTRRAGVVCGQSKRGKSKPSGDPRQCGGAGHR